MCSSAFQLDGDDGIAGEGGSAVEKPHGQFEGRQPLAVHVVNPRHSTGTRRFAAYRCYRDEPDAIGANLPLGTQFVNSRPR